ncbi:MAG TPA: hypothetical protein VEF76_09520 [Patescibacteria group bacterium]|nr:hypothetical protein [Patescibacteria group bacterium]
MPLRFVQAILALLLAPAVYFLTIEAKSRVVEELIAASRRNDAAAFAARIDWDAVKNRLKDDLHDARKGGIFTANFGPSEAQIVPVVEHYIRPENVPVVFYFRDKLFKGVPEEDFIESTGFAPPFGFFVTLAYPKTGPGAVSGDMRALRDRLQVRFVFRLSGMTWKVREMHVPLFMVPSQPGPLPDPKTLPKP